MTCRWDTEAGAYLRADGEACGLKHCLACGTSHVDQLTCAWCVGQMREVLLAIGQMCDALPEEAEARGVHSEAMNLLGPACDVEARGHLAASVASGRVPADYLDGADDEHHPLIVLGQSQMEWEAELEHESTARITVSGALHYLSVNLTYMAQWPHITIADHWAAWRKCKGHLESVLHDSTRRRTGAPCPSCEPAVALVLDGEEWACMSCRASWVEEDYRDLVRAGWLAKAEWLPGADCSEVTGVPAGTIRKWAERERVQKKIIEGRVHYRVAQVKAAKEAA